MTITITSITSNQWQKVGRVALWVILTNAVGIVTAWLANQPGFLALGPALNVIGKAATQIFQADEDAAVGQLPAQIIKPTDTVLAAVDQQADKIAADLGPDPVSAPTTPAAPASSDIPPIGSTANS